MSKFDLFVGNPILIQQASIPKVLIVDDVKKMLRSNMEEMQSQIRGHVPLCQINDMTTGNFFGISSGSRSSPGKSFFRNKLIGQSNFNILNLLDHIDGCLEDDSELFIEYMTKKSKTIDLPVIGVSGLNLVIQTHEK